MKITESRPTLHQSEILRLLSYREVDGALIWNERPAIDKYSKTWNRRFSGKMAGFILRTGYIGLTLDACASLAHRVIWTMNFGEIPRGMVIDHRDGNRSNNRLSNLALVSKIENNRNMKMFSHNKSGISNVFWNKRYGKWEGAVKVSGKSKYVGRYDDISVAERAVVDFKKVHGFSERHGKESGE